MRHVVFVDAKSIWHRRLAMSLAQYVQLTVINPVSGWVPEFSEQVDGPARTITATLPRGWASGTAFCGQRLLARIIKMKVSRSERKPIVFLTSPAYAQLAEFLSNDLPIASYTADDYRSYVGWGGDRIINKERTIYRRSAVSVFVSEALRLRAVREFNLLPHRTFVSPNASEPRFADRNLPKPTILSGRRGPIVGVLGGLSDRLNLESLSSVVQHPCVKTFLVAGPVPSKILEQYPVFRLDKVLITGSIPHDQMHVYASAMDVAVIAYAQSDLNLYCSPMRLYDHLATGVPIFALKGCDQIDNSSYPSLTVLSPEELAPAIATAISSGLGSRWRAPTDCFWSSRAKSLASMLSLSADKHDCPSAT